MIGHSIVSQHFMEPEGSVPNSQELSTCSSFNQGIRPGPRLFRSFRNNFFYGEVLLTPRPTPKAGGPPLVICPRLLIQYIRS
jgi:hypothetical protein